MRAPDQRRWRPRAIFGCPSPEAPDQFRDKDRRQRNREDRWRDQAIRRSCRVWSLRSGARTERDTECATDEAEEPADKWHEDQRCGDEAKIIAQLTRGQRITSERRAESVVRPARMEQGGRKHVVLGKGQDAEERRYRDATPESGQRAKRQPACSSRDERSSDHWQAGNEQRAGERQELQRRNELGRDIEEQPYGSAEEGE